MQDSHTTASFRGVHALDKNIAWVSGTKGTVLHTTDGGEHWQTCATPPDAEKLDFRAVWAWDANRAAVMSIGPGEQSRIYLTKDACAHWTEERRNEDKEGFWDGMVFSPDGKTGVLVGDPVGGRFHTDIFSNGSWKNDKQSCPALPGDGAFAASNSSLFLFASGKYIIGSGGKPGPRVLFRSVHDTTDKCPAVSVPLASGNESSGVFSVAFRDAKHGIVVGGDYRKTSEPTGSAAWTNDGGLHWTAASNLPHGFRSSVVWDAAAKTWISAGPNGSDISHDDGKTWQPLDDGNWNAVSLPFAVGPNGRIGKLEAKSVSAAARDEVPVVEVKGPTLIAFFYPVTDAELDNSPDTNEALGDFQEYASRIRQPLTNAGIEFQVLFAHAFQTRIAQKTTTFRPRKVDVGYYFIAPGKKPRVEYGVNTDDGLKEIATQYFGIPVK